MSHSFSGDLRWRVIRVISAGLSTRKAARRFSIGVSTAGEWYRRYRDHGETTARKQGQPSGSKLDAHEAFILGLVEETPDMARHEIAERLMAERRVSACPATVWRFFDKRGITFKKTAHAAEQDRADVARRRRYWRNWQTWLRPERLVFIDETGAKTNMARRRGRAPKGQRLPAAIPWGHWQTTTFVAGLRTTGLTAPMVIDGAMDGDAFKAYVKQLLVPSLNPGDIVIMDNLSSHKVAGVREAIKAAKAYLLYLPPYSPDFNPIEMVFSKLKALLRKAAARSAQDLEQAIADALDQFTPNECSNYFVAAGYDRD